MSNEVKTEQTKDNTDTIILERHSHPEAQTQAQQAGPPQRPPIAPEEMRKIIGAYARLQQLGSSTIINPRDEAEQKGLVQFLQNALLENAGELFGCWVAVRQEYEPLISGFTALMRRALTKIDQSNQVNSSASAEQK